jgi:two-component system chemotaxis response regulator CheY
VTSSEGTARDIDAGRLAGANFYLVKPIAQDVLAEYVAMMCGQPA